MTAMQVKEPMLRLCLFVLLVFCGGCTSAGEASDSSEETRDSSTSNGRVEQSQPRAQHEANEEDSLEVSLRDIWAWQMPGTKDIRELEPPEMRVRYDSLAKKIYSKLSSGLARDELPGRAFVVNGHGHEALENTHEVIVNGKQPKESFEMGRPLSLVFFSYSSNRYVHLTRVVAKAGSVDVQYKFVPHKTKEMTLHFAVIPLSELVMGEYKVKLTRAPLGKIFVDSGFKPIRKDYVRRIICQPTAFVVGGIKKDK